MPSGLDYTHLIAFQALPSKDVAFDSADVHVVFASERLTNVDQVATIIAFLSKNPRFDSVVAIASE